MKESKLSEVVIAMKPEGNCLKLSEIITLQGPVFPCPYQLVADGWTKLGQMGKGRTGHGEK
jgi:hypothetical protein